jgi:hypothetical protein
LNDPSKGRARLCRIHQLELLSAEPLPAELSFRI